MGIAEEPVTDLGRTVPTFLGSASIYESKASGEKRLALTDVDIL